MPSTLKKIKRKVSSVLTPCELPMKGKYNTLLGGFMPIKPHYIDTFIMGSRAKMVVINKKNTTAMSVQIQYLLTWMIKMCRNKTLGSLEINEYFTLLVLNKQCMFSCWWSKDGLKTQEPFESNVKSCQVNVSKSRGLLLSAMCSLTHLPYWTSRPRPFPVCNQKGTTMAWELVSLS